MQSASKVIAFLIWQGLKTSTFTCSLLLCAELAVGPRASALRFIAVDAPLLVQAGAVLGHAIESTISFRFSHVLFATSSLDQIRNCGRVLMLLDLFVRVLVRVGWESLWVWAVRDI